MAGPPDYLDINSFNLADFVTTQLGQPQALNRFSTTNVSENLLGYAGSGTQDDASSTLHRNPGSNLMDPNGRISLPREMGEHTLIGNAGSNSSDGEGFVSFGNPTIDPSHMRHESFGGASFQPHQRQHQQPQNHSPSQLQHRTASSHGHQNAGSMAVASPHFTPSLITAETLKQQLAQQVKLQQLQQLQNQILQQQIELISSQSNSQREMLLHGLLTPTSSSELRPTIAHNYLSPMTLQGHSTTSVTEAGAILPSSTFVSPALTPSSSHAFSMATPSSLQQATPHLGPLDMFSPLTSPALGPSGSLGNASYHQYDYTNPLSSSSTSPSNHDATLPNDFKSTSRSQPQQQFSSSEAMRRASNKRSMVDESGSRKRQSPMATTSSPNTTNNTTPTSTSQKRLRSTRSRPSSLSASGGAGESGAYSTPSPIDIDISMPPPAPPAPPLPPVGMTPASLTAAATAAPSSASKGNAPAPASSSSSSTSPSPNIIPVTPASIMNLGHLARLPNGLRPAAESDKNANDATPSTASTLPSASNQKSSLGQQRAPTKPRQTSTTNASPAILPKTSAASTPKALAPTNPGRTSLPSTPSLLPQPAIGPRSAKPSPVIRPTGHKHILPGGLNIDAASELARSLTSPHLGGPSRASLNIDTRSTKTSHKAAEQKRRDSLKAGFDELRLLLPPITIDPDSDEPLLPGSAPPRGPQRNMAPGTEDHPNRTVSKLALLKCSNDYLIKLQKRIDRRDREVEQLRDEIKFLRAKLGIDLTLKGAQGVGGPSTRQNDEADVPMNALEQHLEQERQWMDLDRDLDEVERMEAEQKLSGRIFMTTDEPASSALGGSAASATPLSAVDKRKSIGGDTDDAEDA